MITGIVETPNGLPSTTADKILGGETFWGSVRGRHALWFKPRGRTKEEEDRLIILQSGDYPAGTQFFGIQADTPIVEYRPITLKLMEVKE